MENLVLALFQLGDDHGETGCTRKERYIKLQAEIYSMRKEELMDRIAKQYAQVQLLWPNYFEAQCTEIYLHSFAALDYMSLRHCPRRNSSSGSPGR